MSPRSDLLEATATIERQARARLNAVRGLRRGNNRVRRLHHHAVRTSDMAVTRAFYEDVLGLPLVASMVGSFDRRDGAMPFLHCFFELGDGSSLAFFEFPPEAFGPADKLPRNGVDHHIAMAMPDITDIARLKAELDARGHENCGIDHGFCYSLYVRDPNGMLVELVADAPNEIELGEVAVEQARACLEDWIAGNRAQPTPLPPVGGFPLASATPDALERVVFGRS